MGDVGVVIRDHNGNFLAGLSASVDHATSPLQVEFLAARRAILFVLELFPNERPFCFERDSAIALAAMQRWGVDTSNMGPLINVINHFLGSFHQTMLLHVRRDANQVVDKLTRAELGCVAEMLWCGYPPILVQDALSEDVS
ncbi:hypothetical protein EV2_048383 [Malus domestica]